jgi:hypothetical protein
MAAYRDFQNAQAKEYRVKEHQISLFDPTLQEREVAGNQDMEEIVDSQLQVEELWQLIDETFPDSGALAPRKPRHFNGCGKGC